MIHEIIDGKPLYRKGYRDVLAKTKNVMIATPHGNWEIQDWDKDVTIMDGIVCNVGKYLKEKGSEFT